jgi:hypothetical protein
MIMHMSIGTYLKYVAFLSLIGLSACTELTRQPQPLDRPPGEISGFEHIRYHPFDPKEPTLPDLVDAYKKETPDNYTIDADGQPIYDYLAVSGGGSAGAFGSGILNGWTKQGTRPKFKVVTGVSTGALIAPFAFLGPEYDAQLKDAYTTIDPSKVFFLRGWISMLWQESLTDNAPFKELIAKHVDDKMLDRIAIEHANGRRLYVLTTDLDREQPVVWDMGAIASSKSKGRLELFRQVLLASTSVPAIFPPVYIDVTIDGKKRDEMHVDGGVFMQSFFIGNIIDLTKLAADAHPEWKKRAIQRLHVIRNGRIDPVSAEMKRGIGSIAGRSIATLMKVSGVNDLYRLYLGQVTGELDLYYVSLPVGYVPLSTEEFNQAEMIQEYDLGYDMASKGITWQRLPPGYQK